MSVCVRVYCFMFCDPVLSAQERGSGRAGSNVLLENAENYAVYFSSVLDSTNNFTLVTAPNMSECDSTR